MRGARVIAAAGDSVAARLQALGAEVTPYGDGMVERVSNLAVGGTFATNVKGTLFTVKEALPLLRDGASIILTRSTNGNKGGAAFSVYAASKAAIRNFARSWTRTSPRIASV